LYGFAEDQMEVRGHIELRKTFTDGAASRIAKIRYLVVNAPSTYNKLLGRPVSNRIGAIASTRHMKMKLSSLEGTVITIKSDQKEAKRCYENSLKTKRGCSLLLPSLQGKKGSPVQRSLGRNDPNPPKMSGARNRWEDVQISQVLRPRETGSNC